MILCVSIFCQINITCEVLTLMQADTEKNFLLDQAEESEDEDAKVRDDEDDELDGICNVSNTKTYNF